MTPKPMRLEMMKFRAAVVACAISALTILPALAAPGGVPNGNGLGRGGRPALGAPGPIAGAGLAFLVAGGGYLMLRYRKRKRGPRPD
ncbi:MAG: hypothetical protein JWQ89_1756 [Devosia sp.]|nr:hypothetical protein [Devosia sp.]